MGVEPDLYGTMLAPVLLNKLPPDVCLIVSCTTGRLEPKIDQLLKYVEEELTARERTAHNVTPTLTHQPDKVKPTATCCLPTLPVQLCHCVATASRTAHQGIAPCLLCYCLEADSQDQWSMFQLPCPGTSWPKLSFYRQMLQV